MSERTGISEGALFKLEKGLTRPQRRTLRSLLDLYGVQDQVRRDEMEAVLRHSDEIGWLQHYEGDLTAAYKTLISFEAEATRESVFELAFIPGLLQTERYARTIIDALLPEAENDILQQHVEVRMKRQESNPAIWAILDEGVLRRGVGGNDIMLEQFEHLLAAVGRPSVTLQVMPFSAGAHFGMPGSFVILEFADPDPAIVCTENPGGSLLLEREIEVARYRNNFQRLAAQALSPADTIRKIKEAAEAAEKEVKR
ncbi:helix-turn-helix transcriptional regulator [Actinoplanes sp. TRM 88003]|uniref:Helix-turn-helix transcriptional regulator n=1 Tax=Paractinoplanes aksuensis TaxID=2939490 RepID=A0ABT1DRX5_9ACTN|nr:helix-turn-helix transcriptional regulator [Actinoplanes aksuensis]